MLLLGTSLGSLISLTLDLRLRSAFPIKIKSEGSLDIRNLKEN